MKDLRYVPDLMARSLRGGTDATIGLVVESIADPFFSELVAAVESASSDAGKSVLVASTRADAGRELRVVTELLRRRVSGLLVVPTASDHSWLARRRLRWCWSTDRPRGSMPTWSAPTTSGRPSTPLRT